MLDDLHLTIDDAKIIRRIITQQLIHPEVQLSELEIERMWGYVNILTKYIDRF